MIALLSNCLLLPYLHQLQRTSSILLLCFFFLATKHQTTVARVYRASMVAVFNKEVLSWYLLAVKLNETVQANLPRSQPSTPGSPFRPPPPPPIYLTRGEPIPEELQREEEEGCKDEEEVRAVAAAAAAAARVESEWAISIRDRLEQARHEEAAVPWSRFSIYRVPKSLREGDEKSYVPQVVSIGPYHHGKRRLRDMEHHKWRALYRVLRRTGHDVRMYLDAARALEDRCRACYEGRIALSSDEFVEMLVLDGTFVLELFRGAAGGAGEGFRDLGYDRNDPVFAMRCTMHGIQRDMIMLENQLPLFLLDRLFGLQIGRPDQHGFVARLAVRFFDPLMPTDEPLRKADRARIESSTRAAAAATESFDPLTETALHCLDVFRRSLLRTGPKPEPRVWIRRWSHTRRVADRRRLQLIHCVTELREAGIKFRKRKTDRFWDIKFADGVLKIPRLLIHDGTKSLFLNLIALEQCHSDCTKDITSYVIFMDNLINSEEDVSYLHYRGIIEHWLGNDGEVADLFNKLCLEVVFDFDDSYLSELSERVNRYYNHRWNTWGASLKHKYFGNPWAVISLIAAVFLLVLTCAQTFYSVYAYYRPP